MNRVSMTARIAQNLNIATKQLNLEKDEREKRKETKSEVSSDTLLFSKQEVLSATTKFRQMEKMQENKDDCAST